MLKKVIIILLALLIFINAVGAVDSSNWTTANVGYETFKIPPQYQNPFKSDFNMYEFDEDIDVFTIRYVNPNIVSLYGYFIEKYPEKKVNVSGHDAIHFTYHDREEFYYITWIGHNITPEIQEIVKSSSPSKYSHDEFYSILKDEYNTYKIVDAIDSQRIDYPTDSGSHSFFSVGTNGVSVGVIN